MTVFLGTRVPTPTIVIPSLPRNPSPTRGNATESEGTRDGSAATGDEGRIVRAPVGGTVERAGAGVAGDPSDGAAGGSRRVRFVLVAGSPDLPLREREPTGVLGR